LAKTYRVSGVPKTVIDGRIEILGAQPEDVLVAQLVQ
jgi:predicted DsbA family dithiol-disulfide isomerase